MTRRVLLPLCLIALPALADPASPQDTVSDEFVRSVVGAPQGRGFQGDALDSLTEVVSRELRCPVCQGSSVGDSPSPTARHMKQQVRELLGQGYSDEQVISYFVASYGEFVRLAPRASGFTEIVWVAPFVLFLIGLGLAVVYLRRARNAPPPVAAVEPPPAAPAIPEDLEEWLKRVRTLAQGEQSSAGVPR